MLLVSIQATSQSSGHLLSVKLDQVSVYRTIGPLGFKSLYLCMNRAHGCILDTLDWLLPSPWHQFPLGKGTEAASSSLEYQYPESPVAGI